MLLGQPKNLHVIRVSDTIKAEVLAIPSIDENMQKLGNRLLKPKPDIVIDVSPFDGPDVGKMEIMTGTGS